jgi:BirA family biotin operon repressor/biotin-[acetyl-CoA-carboxylase] ligase
VWAIHSFDTLPSTQGYLVEQVRLGAIEQPTAVIATQQTDGHGSRGNTWEGGDGNFFASIAMELKYLPDDLPLQAASIYFGWIMRDTLRKVGEEVWLKWPNDLYQGESKIGGVITQKLKNFLVIGIGVNIQKNQHGYNALSTDISALILLNMFLECLDKFPKWKHLFSKFQLEFTLSRAFSTHNENAKISLHNAVLCDDGSLKINDERIYSLR